jgi:hypothetical protein
MVTRNKSITVTGLHMLLQLSGRCYQKQDHQINIHFVEDTRSLHKLIKTVDRVLWVNYGACLDAESFEDVFDTKHDVLVFPTVKEGVNWNRFKKEVTNGTSEPIHQIGLDFDTEIGTKISDGFWTVEKTNPSVFVIDCKRVEKKMRTKKGEGIKLPRDVDLIFEKFKENEVKVVAKTTANVLVHYAHECLGNILEANGVTCHRN